MIVVAYIVGYLICGMIIGKLAANIFLNRAYRKYIKNINPSNFTYVDKRTRTFEEWEADKKERAYDNALDDTDIDRQMCHTMGAIFWPLTLVVISVYYIYALFVRISVIGDYGLSLAGHDVRKAHNKIEKVKKQRELENKEIIKWNQMVDILNENNLNDITKYEKRKELK